MKAPIAFVLFATITPYLSLLSTGCVQSHTESDKRTLLGGYKHEETTTTRNPITGEVKTTHVQQKVE